MVILTVSCHARNSNIYSGILAGILSPEHIHYMYIHASCILSLSSSYKLESCIRPIPTQLLLYLTLSTSHRDISGAAKYSTSGVDFMNLSKDDTSVGGEWKITYMKMRLIWTEGNRLQVMQQ